MTRSLADAGHAVANSFYEGPHIPDPHERRLQCLLSAIVVDQQALRETMMAIRDSLRILVDCMVAERLARMKKELREQRKAKPKAKLRKKR